MSNLLLNSINENIIIYLIDFRRFIIVCDPDLFEYLGKKFSVHLRNTLISIKYLKFHF